MPKHELHEDNAMAQRMKRMPRKKKGHKMPDGSQMAGATHRAPPPVSR